VFKGVVLVKQYR